jgi:hypothetical protein
VAVAGTEEEAGAENSYSADSSIMHDVLSRFCSTWNMNGVQDVGHVRKIPNRNHMRHGYIIGKLIITTTLQGANAPVVDSCSTRAAVNGRMYDGYCIRLQPWKREFGQSAPQLALVLGWARPSRTTTVMPDTVNSTGFPALKKRQLQALRNVCRGLYCES